VCHLSSLLILNCISSIIPSKGAASLLGEDSEAELLPCQFGHSNIKTVKSSAAQP